MVALSIRLFAMLREAAGCDTITVEAAPGIGATALMAAIAEHHPALADFLPACRLAVGCAFVRDGEAIDTSAEIALIPPVSGG
jgi:molybdopterin synthase catalytic subunit/molybdopterin synthase sulfur carrier subunit